MKQFNINFTKIYKVVLGIYLAIFLLGTVMAFVFGVELDINFSGGTRISYSYTGDLDQAKAEKTIAGAIDNKFTVSKSTALAGDTNTISISLVGNKSLSADSQSAVTKALEKDFADNKIELYDSNSVSPTIAGTFFAKSLVAVLITAILVIIFVGFRFRRIGGISAALMALVALVVDILITFFACVIFRLEIDSNYIAVVLTILGYSLNDTIVVYDRVRENRKLYPKLEVGDLVNLSINRTMFRNIVTSLTTVMAVLTIVIVSEIFGLTSLRTFAIPMAFGVLSGTLSSMFIAGPLWVEWKRSQNKKVAE